MAAAASAATFSIGTAQTGRLLPQSNPFGFKFNSQVNFRNFSGLKAMSSFSGNETCAALRATFAPKAVKENRNLNHNLQPQASYKVAVLGAAGGIGQPLELLIKMSPLVSDLHLYATGDDRNGTAVVREAEDGTDWSTMLPDLLAEIIRRVDAAEEQWPRRQNVVACACVCKRWRDVTRETVRAPLEASDPRFCHGFRYRFHLFCSVC